MPIALKEKLSRLNFITCMDVSHMIGHFSKSNKLRKVNTKREVERGTPLVSKRGKFTMSKSKSLCLS